MNDPGSPGTEQQTRSSNREAHPARSLCACMGLRPPREHACVVARPELTARVLKTALDKRLTLIKAPSGYGKTTLLAEVFRTLDGTDAPHIWFSGSYADRDATWIDAMLAEQLARHCQLDISSEKTFVALTHEVCARRPVIVVLDNWDFVETIETNRYFDRLLQLTDGVANFVVSSRSVPGFAFEVYRIAGEFAEFGIDDLRLDESKIREVLGAIAPSLGSGTLATKLLARTEGWPAGVQLLRLALEQAAPTTKLEFSGSREDVSNYLQETLFSKFDPKTQAFLCHVAHLDELSPELISAILPGENAAETFAQVRRENVLLNEIHEGSVNYRFHTLFRDFLLARAEHYSRWSEAEISARASAYYAARGDDVGAISYAIRAGNVDHTLAMIERYAEGRLVAEGRIRLFAGWVKQLLSQRATLPPSIEYWYRWCLVFTGRWETAAELKHAGSEQRNCIIDAVIGAFSDDQARLRLAVQRWTSLQMSADPFSHAVMFCAAAIVEMARGNYKSAWMEMNKAQLVIRQTEGGFGRTWVNVLSVLVEVGSGRLNDARAVANKAIAEADHSLHPTAPAARMARLASALVAYHQGDEDGARDALCFANTENDEHTLPILVVWSAAIARELGVFWQKRPFEEHPPSIAIDLIAEALSIEALLRAPLDTERFARQMEALDVRLDAAKQFSPDTMDGSWNLQDLREVQLVRLALAQGDLQKAQALISPSLNRCQRDGRGITEMRLSLLRVVVLYRQDKHSAALRLLIQQAERAAVEGLIRPFMELHHMLQPLFADLIEAGRRSAIGNDPAGWRRLCKALGETPATEPSSGTLHTSTCLAKTLQVTPRETEILSYLDLGLTNDEIGHRLGISLPTVKWHLNNLYSKLNVKNRASAVRFARDNRLV